MNKRDKFFKELKELQPFQNESLEEAIKELKINKDKPIDSKTLKKLISKTESLIIQKSQQNKIS